MDHYAPDPRMPPDITDQPGMEVMSEVPGTSAYNISRISRYLNARKPIPMYSSNPALGNSDEAIQSRSLLPRSRKVDFLGSGDRIIAFVVGFLCAAVIIGAVLGGGLGSHLASCQQSIKSLQSGASSATTTSTAPMASNTTGALLQNYRAADHDNVDTLYNTCSQAEVVNVWGDQYIPSCGRDFNNGFQAAEGGIYTDLASLIAYSFNDCMNMCSGFNNKAVRNGFPLRCRSLTFSLNMRNITELQYSNCWLKNGTLGDAKDGFPNAYAMSAKLVT